MTDWSPYPHGRIASIPYDQLSTMLPGVHRVTCGIDGALEAVTLNGERWRLVGDDLLSKRWEQVR